MSQRRRLRGKKREREGERERGINERAREGVKTKRRQGEVMLFVILPFTFDPVVQLS